MSLEWLGALAATCTTLAFVPQAVKTIRSRDTQAPSRLVWNGPPDDVSLGGCKNNSSPRLWG
ncbi:SemiSWEET family sugar transporter [Thermomonas hydrothermalis]|uniref:PQ loop repeat-containing protein n=1 Tax=Thermomonas hydrothermalis TaxID=213588 RepID=A0A1M5A075_9GAMM|nr:PQ-loop domain-containing transporter [Thermomonas hydrothermalis]SHF23614.1 PQ loop repeat-containing protein [Thermomonas hydrothermalis]